MSLSPNLNDVFYFPSGKIPITTAHPTSELFPLLHFLGIAVNQEALGVAEAGQHGLLQELQNDALEQRDSGQDLSSSTEQH